MVTPKRENRARRRFVRARHMFVQPQFLQHLVPRHRPPHAEIEPDTVHVLRIELDRGGKQVEVYPQGLEQMPGVLRMVRAKLHVPILADFRRWNKVLVLTEIGGAPHAHEAPIDQVVRAFVVQRQGIDQDRQVMGVTTDHLEKAIRARHQGGIVDAMRIHLAKAKLAPLGDEPLGVGQVFVPVALVLQPQALRRTIDHHRRLCQGFLTGIGGLHTEFFKIGHVLGLDRQLGAPAHEADDLYPVVEQRPVLVKGDLIDLQVTLQVQEQANDWLAECTSSDDMYDAFCTHLLSSSRCRVSCLHLPLRPF